MRLCNIACNGRTDNREKGFSCASRTICTNIYTSSPICCVSSNGTVDNMDCGSGTARICLCIDINSTTSPCCCAISNSYIFKRKFYVFPLHKNRTAMTTLVVRLYDSTLKFYMSKMNTPFTRCICRTSCTKYSDIVIWICYLHDQFFIGLGMDVDNIA